MVNPNQQYILPRCLDVRLNNAAVSLTSVKTCIYCLAWMQLIGVAWYSMSEKKDKYRYLIVTQQDPTRHILHFHFPQFTAQCSLGLEHRCEITFKKLWFVLVFTLLLYDIGNVLLCSTVVKWTTAVTHIYHIIILCLCFHLNKELRLVW